MAFLPRLEAALTWIGGQIKVMRPRLIPSGGATGQMLAKTTAADYAVGWADPPSGGGGGASVASMTLIKAATSVGNGANCDIAIPAGKAEILIRVWGASHNGAASTEMRIIGLQRSNNGATGSQGFGYQSHSAASSGNCLIRLTAPDTNRVAIQAQGTLGGTSGLPSGDMSASIIGQGYLNVSGGLATLRLHWSAASTNFDAGTYDVWAIDTATNAQVKGFSAFCSGKPAASEKVGGSTAPYALTLSAANSLAVADVAATASTTFVIQRAGTQIGTIIFGAGATAGVVSLTQTAITAGQKLRIIAPATADATLADIDFLLRE